MQTGNRFNVQRPFLIAGSAQAVGAVVAIDDNYLAGHLLRAEKITPADEATVSRWQTRQAKSWSPCPDSGIFSRNSSLRC